MMMTVCWGVALCSLVEIDRRFRGVITLMIEVVNTFKMYVRLYDNTWCSISEDVRLHSHHRENLESQHVLFS
jgi:hypothetical protein